MDVSYRLRLDDSVSLRAVAAEQLEGAAVRLRTAEGGEIEGAIHAARKSLKKTRSLLRLARPDLPRGAYRRENRRLRNIGRSLSGARDGDVLVQTFGALAKRSVGRVPEPVLAELQRGLDTQADRLRAQADEGLSERAAVDLRAALARTATWPLSRCDENTLVVGATLIYRRGRRAMARAERDPTTTNLHDWRKRVKDLWYHARLLRDLHPHVLEGEAKAAHALTELLGDEHDLAVLKPLLAQDGDLAATVAADLTPLIEALDAWRAELRDEAFALGRRIYAVGPKPFARRLRVWTRASPLTGIAE
jgi:CHAD domain-containing protein